MPVSFAATFASGPNGCRRLDFGGKRYKLGFNVANMCGPTFANLGLALKKYSSKEQAVGRRNSRRD
jgi:hypothetical protein